MNQKLILTCYCCFSFVWLGSGIGRACAILLAKEGASGVIVADLDLDAAKDTIAECQTVAKNPQQFHAKAIFVDVTKEDSVRDLFSETVSAFGRIDYCVNSAGVSLKKQRSTWAELRFLKLGIRLASKRVPTSPPSPYLNSNASSTSTQLACSSLRNKPPSPCAPKKRFLSPPSTQAEEPHAEPL